MANGFAKEIVVAFEEVLEGFDALTVMSKNVGKYGIFGELAERGQDTVWRPQPYIAPTFTRTVGSTISASITDVTQLSVPASLSATPCFATTLNANELRDQLVSGQIVKAAQQGISAAIEKAVMDVVSLQGSLVVPVTGAAGDYDDIALADSMMTEQGVPIADRYFGMSTRTYNGMAGNLAAATRSFGNAKSDRAYEKNYVGPVAGFETYKVDYVRRCAANAASITMATNGAQVRYVPAATTGSAPSKLNKDNRFQTITVSSTTGVVAGDAFKVAGLNALHHIYKTDTGQAKTFRVISVDSGTTMTITPPMIGANSSPTAPELAYQNIVVNTTSGTAAITFLNTAAADQNVFWYKDSVELLPGRYAVPTDEGANVMKGTTASGIEIVMTKFFDTSTFKTLLTFDSQFGVVNTNPEMNGILIFGQ